MFATESLIAEHGFDGLRLRDVAKKAGVSIGMIQHYFETRDELVYGTLSDASWRRAAEFVALADGLQDPTARVAALLRGSIANRARCQEWVETCASSTRHADMMMPMIERTYDAWRTALRDAINNGIETGAFEPKLPLEQVVDTLMVMIDGLMVAVALQLYEFDEPYVVRLIEETAGPLLSYDFQPTHGSPANPRG
ncbi:TetR/AcrR family transcriptional regulator [Arthrobacter sp. UYEF3]|uniref:TetR/AcrR family transcriptional regulator n=1 Tax=Arthrobacter sp. UYEF3 TaxID=1756365 RepID=UPI0033960842